VGEEELWIVANVRVIYDAIWDGLKNNKSPKATTKTKTKTKKRSQGGKKPTKKIGEKPSRKNKNAKLKSSNKT